MYKVTLPNGKKMPVIGFGMLQNSNEEKTIHSLMKALEVGFRHIDNAAEYQNEELVGKGIKDSGLPREELFLTSKLRDGVKNYENVKREVDESLNKLGVDYLDLYLINWPIVPGQEAEWDDDHLKTWKAMEELYHEGKLKAIGVSNFPVSPLKNLMEYADVKPMVNQILVHPGATQDDLREYCRENDIIIEAYALLNPLYVLLKDDRIKEMLNKYEKSMAQVLLRFGLDLGVVPLTKSIHDYRIEENFDVFDFELDEEDFRYLYEWTHTDFNGNKDQQEVPRRKN